MMQTAVFLFCLGALSIFCLGGLVEFLSRCFAAAHLSVKTQITFAALSACVLFMLLVVGLVASSAR